MTRKEQYFKFNEMVADILIYAKMCGIAIRGGEWHRPGMVAEEYARTGRGILKSKHRKSLAIDLWIIDEETGKDIEWVERGEIDDPAKTFYDQYKKLGIMWESLGGTWGGSFKNRFDPYHFELKENPA